MFEKKLTGYASNDKPQNKGAKFFEAHPIIPDINIYTAIKVISSFYRDEKAVDCLKLSFSGYCSTAQIMPFTYI